LGLVAIVGNIWHNQLIKKHNVTNAFISECYYQSGNQGHHKISFSFLVNGKKYLNETSIPCEDNVFRNDTLNRRLKGKTLLVIYNPYFPSNNNLLLTKSDFYEYGMLLPDSLKWVDSFLSCR